MGNCLWNQLVLWVGISLGSSNAGMVSKTPHSSGPKAILHCLVPLPSHKLYQDWHFHPQAHNNCLQMSKRPSCGTEIVLSSTVSEVRIRTSRLFYMKEDLYFILKVGCLGKLNLRWKFLCRSFIGKCCWDQQVWGE